MRIFLLIFFLSFPLSANQDLPIEMHPIDQRLEGCLDTAKNAVETRNCIYEAEMNWARELNKNYKTLLSLIKSQAIKDKFKQDQRAWIKFRDSEIKFLKDFYGSFGGTISLDFLAGDVLELTKERVKKLNSFVIAQKRENE